MKSTWVVVADSSRARIFNAETPFIIKEIEDISHSEGRLQEHDLTSDQRGNVVGGAGGGHAFESRQDTKEHEAVKFAKSLAKHIDEARGKNQFEQLMIVSEPSFLGALRKELTDSSRKMVSFELDKNITTHSVEDIRKHLPERLI